MAWLSSEARRGLRSGTLGLAAAAAALTISNDAADARHHHRAHVAYVHSYRSGGHVHRHARAEEYAPPGSSIVVDGNSGAVLQSTNPDALRHPASLTKVMTLYLLFERLDSGKVRLDTPLKVSEHAADQSPTKLDLKPGSTITVEDAIKGVVTRSANDAAVTIAENLGGDEDGFAKMMTQKAHALGMTRTTYVNASGLPDDDQITTARDQALLGRAIQDGFPRYYKYFSTESFVYHGEAIRSHNHLLGSVEGVDGIKTGFTRASGFNLLTSVHRDNRHIVAVVLGGASAGARDARMRSLIEEYIHTASAERSAPALAEAGRDLRIAEAKPPETRAAEPRVASRNAPAPKTASAPIRSNPAAVYAVASYSRPSPWPAPPSGTTAAAAGRAPANAAPANAAPAAPATRGSAALPQPRGAAATDPGEDRQGEAAADPSGQADPTGQRFHRCRRAPARSGPRAYPRAEPRANPRARRRAGFGHHKINRRCTGRRPGTGGPSARHCTRAGTRGPAARESGPPERAATRAGPKRGAAHRPFRMDGPSWRLRRRA